MTIGDRSEVWLAAFDWKSVTDLNAGICARTHSLHRPTSDGHDPCMQEWNAAYRTELRFRDALTLLQRCHRLAPFCFNNGNTFAAIARTCVLTLDISPEDARILRSAAGHYVAGVLRDDELDAILGAFP
jgi:hypothetical protein